MIDFLLSLSLVLFGLITTGWLVFVVYDWWTHRD